MAAARQLRARRIDPEDEEDNRGPINLNKWKEIKEVLKENNEEINSRHEP